MVNVKPKNKRRRYKRNLRRTSKPSKTFVKKVQAIISKNVETKSAYRTEYNSNVNGTITSATDTFQLVPNIIQGLADSNRIGDQTRAKKLVIRGHINSILTYTGLTTCRLGIRIMIVQPKQYSNFAQIVGNATTWLQYLLKKGGSTSAFNGITPDLYADINVDAITRYYDKVFYLTSPYLQTAVGDTSIHQSVKFFRKTFNLRNKLLRYDNSIDAGLTPSNYNPVLLIGYVKLDGSAADANNQVALNFDAYLNFEDA